MRVGVENFSLFFCFFVDRLSSSFFLILLHLSAAKKSAKLQLFSFFPLFSSLLLFFFCGEIVSDCLSAGWSLGQLFLPEMYFFTLELFFPFFCLLKCPIFVGSCCLSSKSANLDGLTLALTNEAIKVSSIDIRLALQTFLCLGLKHLN